MSWFTFICLGVLWIAFVIGAAYVAGLIWAEPVFVVTVGSLAAIAPVEAQVQWQAWQDRKRK